jgi:serine/threonine protein kinase/regulation of enolase protein 1 (concanavalin A-like superfamily)
MISFDTDRRTQSGPSRCGSGVQNLDETGAHPPAASLPTAVIVPGGPPAGHKSIDFLSPPRAPGELGWLAHYRVLRLLGEGGMGIVFLAEDSLLSRPVALKVIRPEIADTAGIAQRFMREARATAAIQHDHIVTIYQVGQENGIPFLAMEYLKGMSLAEWLDRGHRPSVELVLRIGREIAAGLSAAHRHNLIHRDIKPANIWLEAPSGRVKILDFGMARSKREDVEITSTGAVMGTPAFMAPEQARGEPAGTSSDLFSLGCVLYRLCTRRLPFEGDSVIAVLTSISTETPPAPRDLNDRIPASLSVLIMRLLHKMPEARPVSAEVVLKELRSIERELLAERQNAESSEAASQMDVAGLKSQSAREVVVETSPPQPASRPQARLGTLGLAAVLAALVATALVGFILAPTRKSDGAIIAAEPTSAPAGEQVALAPATIQKTDGPGPAQPAAAAVAALASEKTESPRPAQPAAAVDRLAASADRGADSAPTAPTGPDAPRSTTVTKPDLSSAPKVSQREDRLAGLVAASDGKGMPLSRDADTELAPAPEGQTPEGQAPTRREDAWGHAVDPDADCDFKMDPSEDKVRIIVPGKMHILSAEIGQVNAPRILRDIKGDFDLRVRVAGTSRPGGRATTTVYSPYHGAGLVIWQDEENYVRLEIAADLQYGTARPYVNFEYRKQGALAVSRGMNNGDGSDHLRLNRRGDEIYASFGPDGARWNSFPPLTVRLNDRLMVGVTAINSSTKPLTAEFARFDVVERVRR